MVRKILQTLDLLFIMVAAILMPIRLFYPKSYPSMDRYFIPIFYGAMINLALVPRTKLYGDSEDERMLLKVKGIIWSLSFAVTAVIALKLLLF